MRNYLSQRKVPLSFLWFVSLTCISVTIAEASGDKIRAVLVKENLVINTLIKESRKAAQTESDIEEDQIVNILYRNNSTYIVPVRTNIGDKRGCFLYSFDKKFKMSQKITLSDLEEAESCEVIKAVFSCNTLQNQKPGIGILYGKRLGSDHYWFEGSYLNLNEAGTLSEDKRLSNRLNNIETVSKAKKKLGCR